MPASEIRIAPANLRDLSYIAANLRSDDHAEVECQFETVDAALIAALACRDYAFVAYRDGNPEAGFGAARARTDNSLWIAWSWGTSRMRPCLPDMIGFITGYLQPLVYRDGAQRVEARALATNRLAHGFLRRIGATRRCDLPGYGKRGELFMLWDWTRVSWVASAKGG